MNDYFHQEINRVAEVHFFIRPVLVRALRQQSITDEGRKLVGNFENYYGLWTASFSDNFFDMATAIRLGSVIENCLKKYYMDQKGYITISQLKTDRNYKRGIFQQVQSDQRKGVIWLYNEAGIYDLSTNKHLVSIQEAMMHRHLYAHNSGIIDDDYIDKIEKITGQDIKALPQIAASYPTNDTYWFEPLTRLNDFIEEARRFFSLFPYHN
jgi:hypothetical protein